MSDIDWNFGSQKPMETKSRFTKDADTAFDEFCKKYLDSSNGFFTNIDQKSKPNTEALDLESIKPLHKPNKKQHSLNTNRSNTVSLSNYDILKAKETLNNKKTENFKSYITIHKNQDQKNDLNIFLNGKSSKNNELLENFLNKNLHQPITSSFSNQSLKNPNDHDQTRIPHASASYSNTDENKLIIEISKTNEKIPNPEPHISSKIKSNVDNLKPYVVDSNSHVKKQDNFLGFDLYSCGMSKLKKLPIPKANFSIDDGDFGDDAGFFSGNLFGDALGIADGATGNCMLGYDPGDFSRNLMQICSEIFVNQDKMSDAKSLLLKAYDLVQDKTCYGSCTACVLTLDPVAKLMTIANVGDTGYCLLRDGKIVRQSEPQRITFECPRQLDSYPWKEKSRKMGVSYTDILGKDTHLEEVQVIKDDIVILSSDGLFDNLDPHEIEEMFKKRDNLRDVVEDIVYRCVKFYRKPDDILVIIGKIVDTKEPCVQHKYSRDRYTNL